MKQREKRLLVSIHDVGPLFAREVAGLQDLLARHVPANRIAMLVVPDHWGKAPLAEDAAFKARLRGWAQQGVEMFVHGWYHRDTAEHGDFFARLKARHMTAREGEFLGLTQADAAKRMADGRKLIEDITGRAVAGFVAPAWLYGPGARAALAASGFALAEDHMRVWEPASGATLASGPVITWASRSRARIASSLAVAALARSGLARWPTMRLAVHPGDIHVPEIVRSIDRTVSYLLTDRRAGRYADLLEPVRALTGAIAA